MGEAGAPSRVLALSRGSAVVYAAPKPFKISDGLAAPGQLDLRTLRERYRADKLTTRTRILGVLGNPVKQSIGVVVHNAALQSLRIDAVYLPLLSSDVRDFRKAAEEYPLSGFSITIPHKQSILQYVDDADRWVKAAGAANTVRIRRGRWEATNTDIAGIIEPLQRRYRLTARKRLPRSFRTVIVGNGGAARAAVIALRTLGCNSICVTGRAPQKLRTFVGDVGGAVLPWDGLRHERFDLLIHATPVGMWPQEHECLLAPEQIRAGTVFDLVYNPPETKLLKIAEAAGSRVISGIEMYLAQASRQFKFWTGRDAPLRRMRQVAIQELARKRS
jgi:3-dehydroquinate dehydratase/shikimate dehydrogenase